MTFELPEKPGATADELRELEQTAPNVTPKSIRAALVRAAGELEHRENVANDCARILEEALALRVGQMDSASRAGEVDRQVKLAMGDVVVRLRAR